VGSSLAVLRYADRAAGLLLILGELGGHETNSRCLIVNLWSQVARAALIDAGLSQPLQGAHLYCIFWFRTLVDDCTPPCPAGPVFNCAGMSWRELVEGRADAMGTVALGFLYHFPWHGRQSRHTAALRRPTGKLFGGWRGGAWV